MPGANKIFSSNVKQYEELVIDILKIWPVIYPFLEPGLIGHSALIV